MSNHNYILKFKLLILAVLTLSIVGFSQDTVQIDNKVEYFSENDSLGILTHKTKNVFYRAEYARELIMFNNDSAKLEYCFYYDNQRFNNLNKTYFFDIDSDSIIKAYYNNYQEKWDYQRVSDSLFFLERTFNNLTESGFAKKLLPLEKTGVYVTKTISGDTIWTTNYFNVVFPELTVFERPVKDTIYSFCEKMPEYSNGQDKLLKDISQNLYIAIPTIESTVICTKYFISFIVDKEGKIYNIKFEHSCGNGFIERAILITILNLGTFKPGYINNEPVDVKMTIPINIELR